MTDNITLPRAAAKRLWILISMMCRDRFLDADEVLAFTALAAAIAEPQECWCHKCNSGRLVTHMIVCPTCGNKRCPRASDHELSCTDSNEPGQPGSVYALAATEPDAKREPATAALRRWANATDDAPETEFQRGYDAARRWVREVGLPALAEPEKKRAETGIPARSVGFGSGETDPSRGEAYREHITDGSPCWCNPELNYRDPETGAELWIHRREQ